MVKKSKASNGLICRLWRGEMEFLNWLSSDKDNAIILGGLILVTGYSISLIVEAYRGRDDGSHD